MLRGDFIDMHELLPETWRAEEPKESCCRSTRPKRGLVTDITLWTECYALLVAVLSTKHPSKTPHFMGYMRTIIRASRNFEGAAWACYDATYQREVARFGNHRPDNLQRRFYRAGTAGAKMPLLPRRYPRGTRMPSERSRPRRSSSGRMPGEPDPASARTPGR
jgi:hypothetical protein